MAAVGMTFVIVLAEIDISIGSLMSLAMTVGWMAGVSAGAMASRAPDDFGQLRRSTPGSIRSAC